MLERKVIAVDVDGTLKVRGGLNADLVEWVKAQRLRGYSMTLWSARGEEYATTFALEHGIAHLFDHICAKPGYVVDDQGWSWVRFTKVVRKFWASEGVPAHPGA